MNGQIEGQNLPPIDPDLHDQLARRSAGRLPEGLAQDVLAAVDGVSVARPSRVRVAFRLGAQWRTPRTAMAAACIALVAVLATALGAIPILLPATPGRTASPAGYPTDRALTTAELARVMAGPALATNTTLVAAVTIDIRSDVCPMDRYPTLGVIDGIDPQVCVMEATSATYLQTLTAGKPTGTFAFRYLAPGYLGLLGEITPASSSKLAFDVRQDWPAIGKTFLVDAWLGSYQHSCPFDPSAVAPVVDPLDPSGADPCESNWLSDDPTAAASNLGDMLSVPGQGRRVEAGGMRQIDSVLSIDPVHGVFVVRSLDEQCPNASPQDNRGCETWLVLARVADVALPAPATIAPTATPSAKPTRPPGVGLPGVIGPGGRPLTQAEFANAWTADWDHLAGRIVIAKGPIPASFECRFVLEVGPSASSQGCVTGANGNDIAPEGYWAVVVGTDGTLSIVGQLTLTQTGGFSFTVDEAASASGMADGDLFVIHGTLQLGGDGSWWFDAGGGDTITSHTEVDCLGACPTLAQPGPAYYLVRRGAPTELLANLLPIETAP